MPQLKGRTIVSGEIKATAIVSSQPINFLASFAKTLIFKKKKGVVEDKHHPLHGKDIKGKILVVPQSIGSTTGGLVLMGIILAGVAPAAIVCEQADSLMASGAIMAEVWYGVRMPLIDSIRWQDLARIEDGEVISITANGTVDC